MTTPNDLTGKVFGRLTVLSYHGRSDYAPHKLMWRCRCECGSEFAVLGEALRSGNTKSCGCLKSDSTRERCLQVIPEGTRFGRLVVLLHRHWKADPGHLGKPTCICRCDCGKEKEILVESLRSGATQSCGCLQVKAASAANLIPIPTGTRFGRLVVNSRVPNVGIMTAYLCDCDCGESLIVKASFLRKGNTRSCGCLRGSGIPPDDEWYYTEFGKRMLRRKESRIQSTWTPAMEVALRRFQSTCALCGSLDNLTVDHVRPFNLGYYLTPGNATVLCRSCNARKGAKKLVDIPIKDALVVLCAAESFKLYWEAARC